MDDQRKIKARNFLKEFKKIASGRRGIYLIPREESLKTLAELGLTKKNLKEIMMTLSVLDYCEGPKRDEGRPGEIWVFGKQISGKEIYIKLKVAQVGEKKLLNVFHSILQPFPYVFPFNPMKGRKNHERYLPCL